MVLDGETALYFVGSSPAFQIVRVALQLSCYGGSVIGWFDPDATQSCLLLHGARGHTCETLSGAKRDRKPKLARRRKRDDSSQVVIASGLHTETRIIPRSRLRMLSTGRILSTLACLASLQNAQCFRLPRAA